MNTMIEDAKEVAGELRQKVTQCGGSPSEAEDVMLMLASRVLLGDGRLEHEESGFLRALLPDTATGAVSTYAHSYSAKWDEMMGRVPGFLCAASTYDKGHDTHLADHIVDHIEAVAFRAAAIAQPALVECELVPIREYCGFLRRSVSELMKEPPWAGDDAAPNPSGVPGPA